MDEPQQEKTKQPNRLLNYLKIGEKPGKIPELDGLRAIAIILVLLYHFASFYQDFNRSYYVKIFTGAFQNFMQNGWLGVDLFFVLSGYLIFHHLSHSIQQQQKRPYSRYAMKRVLRTFPLYFAMIILIVLGAIPQYQVPVSATDIWVHLLFLQDYMNLNILVPMWSLATEEKFYLLAPLLLFLHRWPVKRVLAILMLIFLLVFTLKAILISQHTDNLNSLDYFYLYRAPFHYAVMGILIGVLVYFVSRLQIKRVPVLLVILVLASMIWMLFANKLYGMNQWVWVNWIQLLVTLGFGFMVWLAVNFTGSRWLRFLTGRTLRIFAVLSYAMYLVHYAVLPWVRQLHRHHIRSEEPWIHALTFFMIYLVVTFLASLVLHYLVEKPFLKWKDKM